MAHFAKVRGGKVVKMMVAEPEFFDTFVDSSPGTWLQCSYNTYGGVHYNPETGEPSADQTKALRKNYPGEGYLYHDQADAFSPPQPYPSWTLNETTYLWEAPVPYPSGGQVHVWNEEDGVWDPVPGELPYEE